MAYRPTVGDGDFPENENVKIPIKHLDLLEIAEHLHENIPDPSENQLESLPAVIAWFSDGGSKGQPSGEIEPLNLSADQQRDLIAFLESLTGPLPTVETGRLPR